MKFTITNIVSERSIDGKKIYYAVSDDGVAVECLSKNNHKMTRRSLYEQLMSHYLTKTVYDSSIKIGDTLGR